MLYNPKYAAGRQKNPTVIDEDVCFHLWLLPVQVMMVLLFFFFFFVKYILLFPHLSRLSPLLFNGVEMASDILVHAEHVDLGLLEHGLHLLVAADLALVCGILEIVGLDVLP